MLGNDSVYAMMHVNSNSNLPISFPRAKRVVLENIVDSDFEAVKDDLNLLSLTGQKRVCAIG